MKIVIVSSAHSVHIRKIADNLVSKGHQVSVFSEESALTESSPQVYSNEIKVFDKWPVNKILRQLTFLVKLNLYLFKNNTDVVWFIYASSYGLLTKRVFTFAKKVVSVWGSDILINSYKNTYIDKISSSLDKADLIFSTSEFLRTHTRRLTSSRMILTPYGPNDCFFDSENTNRIENQDSLIIAKQFKNVIVCTKWLKTVYGIDLLIRAIALDPDFFRKKGIGLLICGEGQDSAFFKSIVETEKLKDIVKFVGYQEENQVINLLDNADLAVFPSRSESFGVSLLESFSRKVPVICSNAGGFSELSLGGRYGHVLDSLEPAVYLAEIKTIFNDGAKYNLAEAQQYANTFPWSKCMDHMEEALLSLVDENGQQEGIKDFNYESDQENAVFIHCEAKVINSNLTRAREIRVAGFRNALQKKYNVQELFASPLSRRKHRKVIKTVLTQAKPKFIYYEGTSSMLSLFPRRYNELKIALKVAKDNNIPFVYYLPDAHEYWDDYVISTRSATNVHLARYRKRKLLKLISKFNATIAYPSEEFREAFYNKIDSKLLKKLKGISSLALPPAASESHAFDKSKNNQIRYVYAGGIGPFYKLHRFLIALNQKSLAPSVCFFIRKGDLLSLDAQYQTLLTRNAIDIHHGTLPKEISDCQPIGILLLEPIDYISVAVPLKFYSYLERGWPILCYEGTTIGNIVAEHGLGWSIECNVNSVSSFINSDLAAHDCDKIQDNIKIFLKKNTWSDRVEQIVGVSE